MNKPLAPHDAPNAADPRDPALMATGQYAGATSGAGDFSRRTFLLSLSALALSACGGGSDVSGATASPRQVATTGTDGVFVHPGILHTAADFDRMKVKYQSAPWSDGWNALINNPLVKLTYNSGPLSVIYRGSDVPQNFGRLINECIAMYGMALRWKLTGDTAWAGKAVQMLNGWTSTMTSIQGVDAALVAGPLGLELAQIAEILRDYSGFTDANLAAATSLLRNVFYPVCHTLLATHNGGDPMHVNCNWDLYCTAGMAAIGVVCDDKAVYDEAVAYFKTGSGNGAIKRAGYYMFPGYLCEWQESGRDQAHVMDGMTGAAATCEIAWHQGEDLYGYDNNRFLAGAEYSAKGNLIESGTSYYSMPFVAYKNDFSTWLTFSTVQQGMVRPCWPIIYNHYVNRRGLSAPYTKKKVEAQPKDTWDDVVGYTTLSATLDPIGSGAAPSGLSAYISAGAVVLSWWGGAYDIDYTVQRAAVATGPYTTVASGIVDLRSYTDTPPAPGRWYYVVTANTPAGQSAPSNQVSILYGVQAHTRLAFDETSGTVAADASGNGHAGTLNGAGALWVAGRSGNALSLNGSSSYVALPGSLMDDVGDFTIAAWVYWNGVKTWEHLFDFGGGIDRYMTLTPRSGGGGPRFLITVNGKFGERIINSTTPFPVGRWAHLAVTLSGSLGTL